MTPRRRHPRVAALSARGVGKLTDFQSPSEVKVVGKRPRFGPSLDCHSANLASGSRIERACVADQGGPSAPGGGGERKSPPLALAFQVEYSGHVRCNPNTAVLEIRETGRKTRLNYVV